MPGHHASVSATASALSSFGRFCRIRTCNRARRSSGVKRRLDAALEGERDLTSLLGDHDRDRVGLLSQADGGAMARAQIAIELGTDRQWKEAGRRGDTRPPEMMTAPSCSGVDG